MRHGKSSWSDPELDDFDRPLNPRGERASVRMGEELRARGLSFDLVLASPARRIVETIGWLEKGYGQPLQPTFEEEIYEATSRTLLQLIQSIDESAGCALLVGHNPGLQQLACTLAEPDDPARSAIAAHYPTAALAVMKFSGPGWSDVGPGSARIEDYLKPRELEERSAGRHQDLPRHT